MDLFAPVLIPTLNRFVKFKKCVESLSKCTHANNTILFVALDYPKEESQVKGYELIKSYLPSIKGFKEVQIFERDKNYGSEHNSIFSTLSIFENFDRLIFSEDDNVFAPAFLDYMNKGLIAFKDNPNVASICGFKWPFEGPNNYPYKYFYSKSFSGWGYGFWREKYPNKIWLGSEEQAIRDVRKYLKNPVNAVNIKNIPYGILESLMYIVKTKQLISDALHCFYNIHNNTYSVFPMISLVRNTGHDGSGVNGGTIPSVYNPFINQKIDGLSIFDFVLHFDYDNKLIKQAEKLHEINYSKRKLHRKIIRLKNYLLFLVLD